MLVQGRNEAGHASAVVVGGGLHDFYAIDVARDAVAVEAQLEVVPLADSDAWCYGLCQRVFAANLHVLEGEDDSLLFLVTDEFLLVALATSENQFDAPLLIHLQIVALGPDAIAAAYIAQASHYPSLIARIQKDVGTDLIVGPVTVANDSVVMPFGCPTEGVRAYGLAET